MAETAPIEPDLLDTLHLILREAKGAERRQKDRRPFRTVQLIAPFTGDQPPTAGEFEHVECHDLSPGGFSFYALNPPTYDFLVLALGRAPFTCLLARVVHHKPVEVVGVPQYLVGCRFMRRLDAES